MYTDNLTISVKNINHKIIQSYLLIRQNKSNYQITFHTTIPVKFLDIIYGKFFTEETILLELDDIRNNTSNCIISIDCYRLDTYHVRKYSNYSINVDIFLKKFGGNYED